MIVKENLSTSGEDVFDELDSSVTRYALVEVRMVEKGNANGWVIGVIRN